MILKVMLLLTGGGPMVILTSSESPTAPALLRKLHSKGIDKFIAYDIPIELAKERYGNHFDAVVHDIHETDQLRILDFSGDRAFKLFRFEELGTPTRYESPA
ncbi:MAG: cytosolic protein [Rhodospirillales bacterium]|nr:cytosolic protein [Rhodospirillales bacterium]